MLVVDDFKDGRDLVVETLEHAGFRTAEAADGPEALSKCRDLRPDLVLMDLSLPGIDGWEVTRRLRADPGTRGLKVLALTAHAQVDALERARGAGVDGVITKPCLPNQVVARVQEALGGRTQPVAEGSS
ncbi:MAG: response regulator [Planctomycetes bacterium]|nr:response regulator [Planctomycetota bacterium]